MELHDIVKSDLTSPDHVEVIFKKRSACEPDICVCVLRTSPVYCKSAVCVCVRCSERCFLESRQIFLW